MQRKARIELCRRDGCTLPEFRSTGFCVNHAAIADVVAVVDAKLARADRKGGQARRRRKPSGQ
jgi:hypothetical protein